MNTKYNNGSRIEKHNEPKGNNSPTITIRTSNGTISKPNPNFVKNQCAKCGKSKGFIHFC